MTLYTFGSLKRALLAAPLIILITSCVHQVRDDADISHASCEFVIDKVCIPEPMRELGSVEYKLEIERGPHSINYNMLETYSSGAKIEYTIYYSLLMDGDGACGVNVPDPDYCKSDSVHHVVISRALSPKGPVHSFTFPRREALGGAREIRICTDSGSGNVDCSYNSRSCFGDVGCRKTPNVLERLSMILNKPDNPDYP